MIFNIINEVISFLLVNKIIIVCLGYIILLLTSGKVVIFILSRIEHEKNKQTTHNNEESNQEKVNSGKKRELKVGLSFYKFWKSNKTNPKKITFANKNELDTGYVIGKCENILILSLVLTGAYTALALIFAAKAIIREDEIKNNSLYFLAGTMINVTYSVIVGLIIKLIITM